jgi:hypothetical protein
MFKRIAVAAFAALCAHAASAESATPAYSPGYGACQAQSCHLDALVDRVSLVEHWQQLHDASR